MHKHSHCHLSTAPHCVYRTPSVLIECKKKKEREKEREKVDYCLTVWIPLLLLLLSYLATDEKQSIEERDEKEEEEEEECHHFLSPFLSSLPLLFSPVGDKSVIANA